MDDDLFNASSMFSALVVTTLVGLALVLVPTLVAVPVLVAVAFACGRLGGRDAGFGSVSAGAFMFGYAITMLLLLTPFLAIVLYFLPY